MGGGVRLSHRFDAAFAKLLIFCNENKFITQQLKNIADIAVVSVSLSVTRGLRLATSERSLLAGPVVTDN